MNHDAPEILAHTDHGHIKMCGTGCVHLTFGRITLHLDSPEEFEALAQAYSASFESQQHREDGRFEFQYSWFGATLVLSGARELARLILEATDDLAFRRGDWEFSDWDLQAIQNHLGGPLSRRETD